jgi:hypothetical protein
MEHHLSFDGRDTNQGVDIGGCRQLIENASTRHAFRGALQPKASVQNPPPRSDVPPLKSRPLTSLKGTVSTSLE